MFDELQTSVARLDQAVEQGGQGVRHWRGRLMTHPGVGPVTSLAFVLIIGPVERFQHSKQVVSYLGLNRRSTVRAGSSGWDRSASKGNPMMRSLLVEAGHTAARLDPQLRRVYQRLKFPSWGPSVAKVAVARKAGREDVLDAAPRGGLRAASSHARQPVGHPGGEQSIAGLIGRLASLRESGSLNNESWSE